MEDLVLSSDEDASLSDSPSNGEDDNEEKLGDTTTRQQSKKQKPKNFSKKNVRFHANKTKKRKRAS